MITKDRANEILEYIILVSAGNTWKHDPIREWTDDLRDYITHLEEQVERSPSVRAPVSAEQWARIRAGFLKRG